MSEAVKPYPARRGFTSCPDSKSTPAKPIDNCYSLSCCVEPFNSNKMIYRVIYYHISQK